MWPVRTSIISNSIMLIIECSKYYALSLVVCCSWFVIYYSKFMSMHKICRLISIKTRYINFVLIGYFYILVRFQSDSDRFVLNFWKMIIIQINSVLMRFLVIFTKTKISKSSSNNTPKLISLISIIWIFLKKIHTNQTIRISNKFFLLNLSKWS